MTRVLLTGEEVPHDLGFSNEDMLRRAITQKGVVQPEMSVLSNTQILAIVKPLADGKGVLLMNLPLDFLRKSLEGFSKKEGGKIKLTQKLGSAGEDTIIVNLDADALNSKNSNHIIVNNPNGIYKLKLQLDRGEYS